jgi:hypothetical protein
MAQHGSVPAVQAFLVLPGAAAADGGAEVQRDVTEAPNGGKGKEKAEETMQDITNSYGASLGSRT